MTVFANGKIVTPDGVLEPGWIEVSGDRITGLGEGQPQGAVDVDLAGKVVVPGFVDIHTHGGGGTSYPDGDPEKAARAALFHRSHGTTTTIASLVTAPGDVLERQLGALVDVAKDGLVAGIHLEGPWISVERRGAHDPNIVRPPTRDEVGRMLKLGGGHVRMVTLAPELPGGMDAVRQVIDADAVVAVGHSDASYEVVREAIDAGATVATHLFNGMPPVHHRKPGPVVALLEDPRATVELIADGHHLHHGVIAVAVNAAGPDRVALVTDAMTAAGMSDGTYDLGGRTVVVEGGLVMLPEQNTIAGSTLTMDAAFRFAVQKVGLSLVDAAKCAATTPARVFGFSDVGALRDGLRADLVILDPALNRVAVMQRGEFVYEEGLR
ncbi:N-acetylglucosamine-6-phosphate deacetylase [Tenggerimyces flavus]|uniref:N-acetylglucosamine-6-phosphate deacetylase n=1 Tax=Tenggerimyces flavus TaxID=1708749 RepID=A0ABV7Y7T9_9ACTN|nr:N-acetylglucosamine-6-phosphate deacetylase [Tenggerimyces flavus]MBM7785324.1 N-acetylglucosamine-6-phosphate deacetylase [Tenggerimyces flavus]